MIGAFALLFVFVASMCVIRVASVALVETGMARDAARFQAVSAFTGVGFTTSEAESGANHPMRRKIVIRLMVAGNVGIVSGMSSLVPCFVEADGAGWILLGGVAVGMLALSVASSNSWVDRSLSGLISRALQRFTKLEASEYSCLLQLPEDHGVSELRGEHSARLCGRTLRTSELLSSGILALGLERATGGFVATPDEDVEMSEGDRLILYGRLTRSPRFSGARAMKTNARTHLVSVPIASPKGGKSSCAGA